MAKCFRCGCELVTDKALVSAGYSYYCPECDEDFYGVEVEETDEAVEVQENETGFSF